MAPETCAFHVASELYTHILDFISPWGTSSCVIHALSTQRMLALIRQGTVQARPQTRHTYELTHSTTMFFHRFLVLIILTMQVLWGFLCSSCSSSGRKHETHTLRPFLSEGNERPAAKGPLAQTSYVLWGLVIDVAHPFAHSYHLSVCLATGKGRNNESVTKTGEEEVLVAERGALWVRKITCHFYKDWKTVNYQLFDHSLIVKS